MEDSENAPGAAARGLLRRAPRLMALPQSAARASRVAEDPESSIEELAGAFSMDAALCSHLLKVANSAYYGLHSEVASIPHAAVLLGRHVLRNVALAASMQAIVHRVRVHRAFSVAALWKHSIRTAAAASILAEASATWEPQEAFAAGLIHDLGLLVELETDASALAGVLDELEQLAPEQRSDGLRPLERRAFGADHQDFGAALCEAWGFPATLRDAAGHHHDPWGVSGTSRTLAALVRTAEFLGASGDHGHDEAGGRAPFDAQLLALLGLDTRELAQLEPRIAQAADEVEVAFHLKSS